jgi:hypothetical protein
LTPSSKKRALNEMIPSFKAPVLCLNSPFPPSGLTLLIAIETYPVLEFPTVSLGISLTHSFAEIMESSNKISSLLKDI